FMAQSSQSVEPPQNPGRFTKVGETCRKHGISEPTYYKWESQFSGMTVSHLTQRHQLQDENAKLKLMYADLALMHHVLKD
ncbi:transposase, partial [Escherichia coli]|uniref:transposase n=1 Tax=Escherichia coli TaxID=562 RepID=UPI0013B454CA